MTRARIARAGMTVALAVLLSLLPWSATRDGLAALAVPAAQETPEYEMAIKSVEHDFVSAVGDVSRPADGRRWVLIAASLQNVRGETAAVETGALTLVDRDGRRYQAEPPNEHTQPSLVGSTVERGRSQFGLVLFDLPRDAVGARLEWCPSGTGGCESPVRFQLPDPPTQN